MMLGAKKSTGTCLAPLRRSNGQVFISKLMRTSYLVAGLNRLSLTSSKLARTAPLHELVLGGSLILFIVYTATMELCPMMLYFVDGVRCSLSCVRKPARGLIILLP